MTGHPPRKPGPDAPQGRPERPRASREDRLKAALKANMARRKAQMRARADTGHDGAADDTGKDED